MKNTDAGVSSVHTPKISEVVANKLRAKIIRGELKEGETLPPESQLMKNFGVSRPTLRESIRLLESEKLISITRGSRTGARVHAPTVAVAARYSGYLLQSQGVTISDLYESQLAIEPYAVRALSKRKKHNTALLKELREHADTLDDLVAREDFDGFFRGIADFHLKLVEAAGNKTLAFITQLLHNLMIRHKVDFQYRSPVSVDVRIQRMRAGISSFRKLITLAEKHDAEGAVAHWRLHLKNAHAIWNQPGEGERIVESLDS